ncbi:MAG: hypothetical protein JXP34_15905 [Planctomycetes bacterium]|nr:hypothetical protein [Planctomycetota bacterium]
MRAHVFLPAMAVAFGPASPAAETDPLAWLDAYDVTWTAPSANAGESMPVGGHDIGLNLWVEGGDLLFYVQRSGCFDENNEFLKLGRIRVRLAPNPFDGGKTFRQTLRLRDGAAEIEAEHPAHGRVNARVWVEVHRPVIHVDLETQKDLTAEVSYETWRTEDLELPDDGKNSRFGCFDYDCWPGKVFRYKDAIRRDGDRILWYHRNRNDRLVFDLAVEQQGLAAVKDRMWNPLADRTFGGLLAGRDMVPAGEAAGEYLATPFRAWKIASRSPARRHAIRAFLHTDQAESFARWRADLEALAASTSPSDDEAWQKNRAWWGVFWDRSRLVIDPEKKDPKIWELGRNYQLFRYQLGSNAFGAYPTKFNGGLFTFDPVLVASNRKHAPDWRAWGGGSFTAQNQRLVHWPMLKAGDFDLLRPQFEFYRRALENATLRVRTYWGHEGCLFTEQMAQYGLPIACAWGWDDPRAKGRRRAEDTERGVQVNPAVSLHYEAQLEFSYMILEHHRFTGADLAPYLPFIERSVRFFDEHYQMRERKRSGKPLDEDGKLVIYPSTSCESYRGAKNPSDLIAGLRACLASLLDLPDAYAPPEKKAYWRGFLARVPDFAYGEADGARILKPAWSWTRYQNVECPQFYPLFPFDRFALGRDDEAIRIFRNTWQHGTFPKGMVISWHQDGIFFARMGMTEAAADYNAKKMASAPRRFPTFWGPGHDWVPDHNWGGSGMIGLQEMLLQTVGREIRLLPAWPSDWDADFKLHAPYRTVVEGKVRDGKVIDLRVSPDPRRADVAITTRS